MMVFFMHVACLPVQRSIVSARGLPVLVLRPPSLCLLCIYIMFTRQVGIR
jgi:hypothetical protein